MPAGGLDPGETFPEAALRETREEAGIDITLKGVLRVEHTIYHDATARMRVVFYAEPTDPSQQPKSKADTESEFALWVTIEELLKLAEKPPGLRGTELLDWATYIETGGIISPLHVFSTEATPVPQVKGSEVDPSVPINYKKWTELHVAVKKEDEKAIDSLLARGANINAKTHKGRNVLHFAVMAKIPILKMILSKIKDDLEKGNILNAKDVEGNTPLHFAASFGSTEVCEMLIKAGADPNLTNNEGKTSQDLLNKD